MKRLLRADLSGPILAIIITAAVVAAGLGLIAYFWWVAPQASKTATVTVVGEPALMWNSTSSTWTLYITLKNTGTASVNVEYAVINGYKLSLANAVTLGPGEQEAITFTYVNGTATQFTGPSVEGTVITDGGVIPFSAYVISG